MNPATRCERRPRATCRPGWPPPTPAAIFDPYNVTQLGPDLFQRAAIPNAIIPNPNPYALKMYSFYPAPTRIPDDVFNTNNFQATTVTAVRRNSLNNRIDYKRGAVRIVNRAGGSGDAGTGS